MKSYVITLVDLLVSVEAAERCITSCAKYGVYPEIFPAITPDDNPYEFICDTIGRKISRRLIDIETRPERVMSCFASQLSLWAKCAEGDEDFLVLEHDARMVNPMPSINARGRTGIMSLGKPSWGDPSPFYTEGVNNLNSTPHPSHMNNFFLGNHAILFTPEGCREILTYMKDETTYWLKPADMFLDKSVLNISEYYPHTFIVDESFTTVQDHGRGIDVKLNIDKESYKVL
jgi:GR25 family glycosyltransferase involved in LPS biosynthesis|tara:strand:+ start:1422 stop:2114 length:693 start_codon:yes stop_codon:yes gene_type:complete